MSSRILRSLIVTVGAVAGLACGDYSQSTSPASYKALPPTLIVRSSFTMLSSGTKARAVRWGPAHSTVEQSVSAVIGPDGGTLSLPGSDFSMNIPSGALEAPTAITVIAKAGPHVAYEMLPHGLRFLKPVNAVQGLRSTAASGRHSGGAFRAAYLPEGRENIDLDDSANPSELEAGATYYFGAEPVAESQVWIINHFSRYILISGVWTEVPE
jgi:hypothetical protein